MKFERRGDEALIVLETEEERFAIALLMKASGLVKVQCQERHANGQMCEVCAKVHAHSASCAKMAEALKADMFERSEERRDREAEKQPLSDELKQFLENARKSGAA